MFFIVVLSGALLMSGYAGWRAGTVPWIRRHLPGWARATLLVLLGSSYVLARYAEESGFGTLARALEFLGAHWMGVLLLASTALLAVDVLTLFGLLFKRHLPSIRAAALVAGAALSIIAVVQGNRAPVVRDHEVRLGGLPAEREGTVIVFVSDLHLGSLLGGRWLARRTEQIAALHPAAIVLGGDILEGDSPSENALLPVLGRLSAPLGVWAVAGNHEYHGRGAGTLQAMEQLGIRVLRNEWRELAPGLVLAGVDRGRELHDDDAPSGQGPKPSPPPPAVIRLARSLADRPANAATILVSHQPVLATDAARAGVGLMLSGHTHDGQIWPFRYLVRLETPYLAGRYDVDGMPLLVCRGTGTFGPRMRLWYPSEILRITLRGREPKA